MARTIIALFETASQAGIAVQDLVNAGYAPTSISVITQHEAGDAASPGEATAVGVGTGALLGGVGGLLVGLGALAIPGIGPVLAAGPLAGALAGAGLGAAAGGVIGALAEVGVPEEEAGHYAEGIRRGGALVVVHADDDRAERAISILGRHDPIDLEDRVAQWRRSGWTQFDRDAHPYTTADLRRDRDAGEVPARTERVGEPVTQPGVYGGMRDRAGRSVRAYTVTPDPAKGPRRGGSAAA